MTEQINRFKLFAWFVQDAAIFLLRPSRERLDELDDDMMRARRLLRHQEVPR